MKKLDEAWGHKGLQVVTAYTQFQDLKTIEKYCDDIGMSYPVALDGFFASRFTAPLLCQVWVIGPDGKVTWTGIDGWEEATMKALLKLEYAGLEIDDVQDEVKPAAEAFGTGEFAKAYKLADEVAFGDYSDKTVAQAELIVERIEDQVKELNNRVTVHEISGRFDQAIACLEELRKYAGLDDVPDVDAEIKRIKALENYETEMTARRAYLQTRLEAWRGFEGIPETDEATIKAATAARDLFQKFAKDNQGTTAGSNAKTLAANYELWISELKGEEADSG